MGTAAGQDARPRDRQEGTDLDGGPTAMARVNPGIFGLTGRRRHATSPPPPPVAPPPPAAPPAPASYGLWTIGALTPGLSYDLSVTWTPVGFAQSAQVHQVLNSTGAYILGEAVTLDCQGAVGGFTDATNPDGNPTHWAPLGSFVAFDGGILVRLSGPVDGLYVMADGLRVQGPSSVLYLDDQGGAYSVVGTSPATAAGQAHWYDGTYTAFQPV